MHEGLPLLIGGLLILAFLTWWLLIASEGVYLGQRVVIALYDLYADRYDRIKQFMPEYDHLLLAKPIMQRIAPHQSPMVLDVATGTGRLPDTLLDHALFQGRIIAIDLSRRMLQQAARKLHVDQDRVLLMRASALDLPFHDASFDVVTCLEALEFLPDQNAALLELSRVLRPGGLLLVTNRINTRWMPRRTRSRDQLQHDLAQAGFAEIAVEAWQVDYQRVWAVKSGTSAPVGARPPQELIRCPGKQGPMDADWCCNGEPAPFHDQIILDWQLWKANLVPGINDPS